MANAQARGRFNGYKCSDLEPRDSDRLSPVVRLLAKE